MALTLSSVTNDSTGNGRLVTGSIAFGSSYPTGGESLTARTVGLSVIDTINVWPRAGYTFDYNSSTAKLLAYADTPRIFTYAPGGGDIKGSANTNSENVDAASVPTNGQYIMSLAAVAAGAWTYSETLEIDIPRNVCILIANDTAGALNLYKGAGASGVTTFTITGTFRGGAQSDTVTFTSTAANQAVGFTPNYRYKYGVKPFDRITLVALDNPPDDGLKIGVGIGSKIGYPMDSATGADVDFAKLIKTGADLAVATIIDHTNKTVNFGTLADGNDVSMTYAATSEAANGLNLSGLTGVRFEARGV